MLDDEKPLAWWQYPSRQWFRDQAFWREVTARALSTLIAAGVVFALGGLLGYIGPPPSVQRAIGTGFGLLALIVLIVIRQSMQSALRRGKSLRKSIVFIGLGIVTILMSMGVYLMATG